MSFDVRKVADRISVSLQESLALFVSSAARTTARSLATLPAATRKASTLAILLAVAAQPTPGPDCYTKIAPVYYETDVRSLIRAVTPADVERIRGELITYIWKSSLLPGDLPEVHADVANPFPDFSPPPNVVRIDRLTVSMDGFVSNMYLFVPKDARQRLIIFHNGHSDSVWPGNGTGVVRFFLERRYLVLIVHMPLYGPNTGPFGHVIGFHNPMRRLETTTLSPIKYFLEPVVRAVNYSKLVLGALDVSMIGLSGGGWTTTLSAAIDPRIRVSIPVAGSLPRYLREPGGPCTTVGDRADFEQNHPPLYAIADYLDLYILGSHGPSRGQLQVLNQYDSCCFNGVRALTYRDILKDVIRKLPNSRYDLFIDSSHKSHRISQYALETAILPFLEADEPASVR